MQTNHITKLTDLNLSNIKSISNLIRLRVETSPNQTAFSYWKRSLINSNIDNNIPTEPTLSQDSWQQFNQRFKYLAHELKKSQFNKIGVFLPTSYSWVLTDAACLSIGATSLVYHNAWQETELCHAINIEIPDVIICCDYSIDILKNSLNQLNLNIPIILLDVAETYFFDNPHIKKSENSDKNPDTHYTDDNKSNNITHSITFIDIFNHIENIEDSENITQDLSEKAHTVAFTSGSGGSSKAVLLSQYSLLKTAIESYQTVGLNAMNSTMFHWMPLSHVFGRVGIYIALIVKGHSYFSRGITHFMHDIQQVKPSLLFAVPKVMTRLQTQIKHAVIKKPKHVQKLIHIFEKMGNLWQKLPMPFAVYMHKLQKLLFKPIHQQLGGNILALIVGGAPVCKQQKQYFEAIGIRVCEGFGMTETAGVVSVQPYFEHSNGCGKMLPSVEASFSEQGELLLKGDILLKEYIKNSEQVKPWFNTGDVAKITDNGYLHIIGRTKEIIITENGENVHPSKIEDLITHHQYVEDVCVVGDNQASLLALINIDAKYTNADDLHQKIKQHLHDINLNLPRFERVYHYIIVPAFAKNDLLTVTHKKKRQAICTYHKVEIEEYYKKLKNKK
jgi:long-chain acyl-CoA synthetase